jgi:hypothetical protein
MPDASAKYLKRLAFVAGIVLAVIVASVVTAVVVLEGRTFEIQITQEQIQQRLDEKFPVAETYPLVIVDVDVAFTNPRVALEEGSDRVGAGVDSVITVRSSGQPQSYEASGDVTFGIFFRPETGELFLTDMQFERLDVPSVPPIYMPTVRKAATTVAQEALRIVPVYQLTAEDTKTTIARLILKDVNVRDGVLIVTLGL